MHSVVVGEGFLAATLVEQVARSGVAIERAPLPRDPDAALPLGGQRADQIVVLLGPGECLTERMVECIDGPRWLVCSPASETFIAGVRDTGPAHVAEEAALRRGGTVVHLSALFGRGGDDNVTRLALFARRYRTMGRNEDPGRLVQPLHVDDLAALVGCHLRRPSSGCFDAAGPEVLPVAELWQSVAEILGVRSRSMRIPPRLVRALDRRGTGSREAIDWGTAPAPANIDPARARFGWHPLPLGIRIEQGVREAVG